jgi:hypothetical protein
VTLTLTTNDPPASCNAATDTMTIKINANPVVNISLENACDATAHLHATVTGGVAPYTFTWKKNGVAVGTNSADLALSGPGTYTVSVTDSSATSCPSNTDTFVVCFTEGRLRRLLRPMDSKYQCRVRSFRRSSRGWR